MFYSGMVKHTGFQRDVVVKNPPANAGDAGLIPVLGRSPGGGNGNPLQFSCLGNPLDREAWWATVHGVAKSWTWQRLNSSSGMMRHADTEVSVMKEGVLKSPIPRSRKHGMPGRATWGIIRISHGWGSDQDSLLWLSQGVKTKEAKRDKQV